MGNFEFDTETKCGTFADIICRASLIIGTAEAFLENFKVIR
jgi:hypothetical protein